MRVCQSTGPWNKGNISEVFIFFNRHFIPIDQWGQKSSAHRVWSTAAWHVSDLFTGNWGDIHESYLNMRGRVVPCRETSSSLLFAKSTGLKPNSILSHLQFKMYKTADLKSTHYFLPTNQSPNSVTLSPSCSIQKSVNCHLTSLPTNSLSLYTESILLLSTF